MFQKIISSFCHYSRSLDMRDDNRQSLPSAQDQLDRRATFVIEPHLQRSNSAQNAGKSKFLDVL
jgi:hypothetical protein